MNDLSSFRDQVRQFITNNFYVADVAALSDDASLLDRGIIDSTGVLELIEFLETTFTIKVADAEMIPENLDSIGRITAFIDRKKGGAC
jgi:acyl carrier protein